MPVDPRVHLGPRHGTGRRGPGGGPIRLSAKHTSVVAILAVVAAVSSVPRFGQRENDASALSDSDYYLDMASVFSGDKPTFDPTWSSAAYFGAHHYSRPLLPFLAAAVVRAVPRVSLPSAFSLVNVLAA